MNMRQVTQPISSSNGYNRRKDDVQNGFENKFQTERTSSGKISFGKGDALESSTHDRLVYISAHLIGQQVEIQLLDGSVYGGIFHAINSEDYGIVLKMAHVIKDASCGQKNIRDLTGKPLAKTFIVPATDLVQVIAKGVSINWGGLTNESLREKQLELMTDSCISQSKHIEVGRELERWVPDENDPRVPDLEDTFDGPWNRGWDQFQANETLFGVTSTFDEELYTTKLERGPRMSELERVAERLAREIEGEDTRDLHLAEERGLQISGNLDIDEETLYSSVYRRVDDSGFDEIEDIIMNSKNEETFAAHGGGLNSVDDKLLPDANIAQSSDGPHMLSSSSVPGQVKPSHLKVEENACHLGSDKSDHQKLFEQPLKHSRTVYSTRNRSHQVPEWPRSVSSKDDKVKRLVVDQSPVTKADELDRSRTSPVVQEKESSSNELERSGTSSTQGTAGSLARPSSSISSTSDRAGIASTSAGRGLSSSSSFSSLSSEKSTLNPNAKEFKLNPNAKSFVPRAPVRPPSPIGDSPFYYSPDVVATAQIHGMPLGIGMGPSFAVQQPVMFSPQAGTLPQPYYGPQYGQQVMVGQQRPLLFMPTYPPEMPPYKGREF